MRIDLRHTWGRAVRFDPLFFVVFPVFVLSVVVHECAHGVVALWCGDSTARDRGRLTLNPVRHIDPMGSLVVPGILYVTGAPFLFGWARPVPVERAQLRDLRNGPVFVALAGPASNILLAIGFAALARIAPANGFWSPLRAMGYSGVLWNCALAIFNLVPIPLLDGSWVVMRFMRLRHILALHHFRTLGFALLLALMLPGPSRALFQVPLAFAVHTCLGLFGLAPTALP